jgi:hypothetical protein
MLSLTVEKLGRKALNVMFVLSYVIMLSIASEENLVLTKIAFLVQVYQSNTEL